MKNPLKKKIGKAELWLADCQNIVNQLKFDAIVSDPPYGGNYNTDYTRFSKGACDHHEFKKIQGDEKEFDPVPWIKKSDKVILFGYPHFANKLPLGTILVWAKKRESKLGKFCSDCELAWMNFGHGCYLFHYIWDGFDKDGERKSTLHPTQKPIALMRWCISKLQLPKNSIILDPYMGTGSTGIAAIQLGHQFLGIECESTYFDEACRRMENCQKKRDLFNV